REIAVENPDAEAFLVQMNPRVTSQFTGQHSRVLHALERETGRSFHFEGTEGLALDHFAVTFQGSREEVEERALPFHAGDEVLVEIVEPHMYDVDDAVAKIDGYIISIAGASAHVGEKRMVRIEQVGRTAASALLLDENGEVVHPAPRPSTPPARRRARKPRSRAAATTKATAGSTNGGSPESEKAGAGAETRTGARVPRRRAATANGGSADDAELFADGEPGTTTDADLETATDGEPGTASPVVDAEIVEALAERSPLQDESLGDGAEDDVQSKPRRRGRRGGRRRSSAKKASTAAE
ncbi:MAG TPA: ribonuclease E, partial [Solirubrobacteraceae bacterium]|nr:ribonuclease E [Solirubrobacteraceae bacterium]